MRLVVNEPGSFIGTKNGMITVYKSGEKILEVPIPKINFIIVLTRGASFSSALVKLLAKHNIPIIFYSPLGYPISICKSFITGSIELRKNQYKLKETVKGIKLASLFAQGKTLNQYSILYSMAKNRTISDPQLSKELYKVAREIKQISEQIIKLGAEKTEKNIQSIINLEAEAAKLYWGILPKPLSKVIEFPGRKKRFENPTDPVNISLNYLYTILGGECSLYLELCGLDPYAGFLHADTPRRPALAMDLMEEFRQQIVDRVVFKAVFERKLDNILENNRLKREARLMLYKLYTERINTKVTFLNRSLPIQDHIFLQARRIGEYIMGRQEYKPFIL
ncbi:MAG: CRISPR-associated endonuclease Cas1 [Candidatus Odinarchaeum yellowstonii]|uniref:CRISPR-associated endonuclease Cas1 n=1 Tax=Odinarchaeota yellowstonii (strain LCB_4) TaxID=1841599 RepID=A0AAF0D291_ODILC|nr:MAG: CRISPR-associated endonuclease Cas1 [Candidatus Odinarchaeum yellowstonii]